MLAPQNNTNDITDTLSGSLTTWYQNVDSALKASECVPGYYEYAQAPSYGTQCPIQEGGSTKIDIQTARFNVIDIDNSYIDVDFTVPISLANLNLQTIIQTLMETPQNNIFIMLVSNLLLMLLINIEFIVMVI